ncbi:MAG: cellulase family glycosylhydrolase [Treponema sp.]|jgi:hypothetical protein|nr:cellulase family glycosylhydrolase [Treponema sp.]
MKEDNYKWLKGFNYVPSNSRNDIEFWRDYDPAVIEREMGYASRLGLNCARPFLAYVVYKTGPEKFIKNVTHFVQTAFKNGIRTMPVVWDSCFSEKEPLITADSNEWFANPGTMYLGRQFREEQYRYCDALMEALRDEPGLLMWDVHNEPWVTSYYFNYQNEEKERHFNEILEFVKDFTAYFRQHDSHPVTVGVENPERLNYVGELCDVLSFHDYSPAKKIMEERYDEALAFSKKLSKPVICSETGCPARANPYDIAIETAREKGVGFILWELMIGKCFWGDRHGIVYPDGTIRDPATVAALAGFYRRRDGGEKDYNLNTESLIDKYTEKAAGWLENPASLYGEGLDIVTVMANLVESGSLVPLNELPTSRVLRLETSGENREALKTLMQEWAQVLKADADKKRSTVYSCLPLPGM